MQWPKGVDPYPGTMRTEHVCTDCELAMELPLFVWVRCDCDEQMVGTTPC